jgi:exopolyphosphatase/guanosine-5'-triphosphate,3'-diphosphate pyrophosphatase
VVKAPFPLTGADVAAAFEALRQPVPTLGREVYTLEQFVAELVEPTPAIRAVRVHKRRRRYTIHGCPGELSDVEAAGKTTRTIAVETEDPARLVGRGEALGMGGRVNTSFPEGSDVVDDEAAPLRRDRLRHQLNQVPSLSGGATAWTKIVDRAEITRLGEGVGAPPDLDRAVEAHRRHRQGDGQRGSGPPRSSRGRRPDGRAALADNRDEVVRAIGRQAGSD